MSINLFSHVAKYLYLLCHYYLFFPGKFFRSNHQSCFAKKVVLKNFVVFAGKLQTCNFIKKRLQHRCFPLNICKIFKNTYFKEHLLTVVPDFLKQPQNTGEQSLASLLTLLFRLNNLLTVYEQLSYWQFSQNHQFVFH